MNEEARWNMIIGLLSERESISVNELSELTSMSKATIRRDLQHMEDQEVISRFYGGAKLIRKESLDTPVFIKLAMNAEAKVEVARSAARLIQDDQLVFLNSGSAVLQMVRFISARNICVVTNNILALPELSERRVKTILLGGAVDWYSQGIYGAQAIEQASTYRFDLAFLGVNGIHKDLGIASAGEGDMALKREIVRHSAKSYALADSSKFNHSLPYIWDDGSGITVLTDTVPEDSVGARIRCICLDGSSYNLDRRCWHHGSF